MDTYGSPDGYLYNLHTSSPSEAKRMWKESIKSQWGWECAYCGSTENLTLDHIVPRSRGGSNHTDNILCACVKCNSSKAYDDWITWYIQQPFFTESRRQKIEDWMFPLEQINPNIFEKKQVLYHYDPRNHNYF